jgi:predicted amidohydrolase YtcJ
MARSWPLKSFLDTGANVASGSDWPVADRTPQTWTGIETMVTRQAPGGSDEQLNPGEALSLEEALLSFTRRPAEALGLGDVTGSIEVGKSADFLLLSQNLFEVDPHQIHKTVAEAVYLRGALVHSV